MRNSNFIISLRLDLNARFSLVTDVFIDGIYLGSFGDFFIAFLLFLENWFRIQTGVGSKRDLASFLILLCNLLIFKF